MSEGNTELIARIQDAWNRNAVDELDQHFADDFVAHSNVPGMPPGLTGAKAAHGMVRQSLPDQRIETLELFEAGDKVVMRNRVTGTNTNGVPWLGAEPNGQPYDFESWSIYTVRNGKVTEHVGINDAYLFAIQAGAIKPAIPA